MAGSSPAQRLIRRSDLLYSHVTATPASRPPIATFRNSSVAPPTVNTIVPIATAIANFSATRPDASFIRASPSSTPIMVFGMRPLPTIPPNATASVGESTAARANAATKGTSGNRMCRKYPTPTTVMSTSTSARPKISRPWCKNSRVGVFHPSANSSGGINSTRKSSGSKSTCRPKCGHASRAPIAICISGNGIWNGNIRVTTPDKDTTRIRIRIVKKISMLSLVSLQNTTAFCL